MSYVYITSETAQETGTGYPLLTVGFYNPQGQWVPESDHGGENGAKEAAERVAWLNDGRVGAVERNRLEFADYVLSMFQYPQGAPTDRPPWHDDIDARDRLTRIFKQAVDRDLLP